MINANKKIYVAGHNGMVGSAIVRALRGIGFKDILTASRAELDLTNQESVDNFFKKNEISYVYNAAAKVGGIVGNANLQGDFILGNLMIKNNLINACFKYNIDRYIFLGSCCIYPKFCPQPMLEDYLITGELEPTNR